MKYEEVYAYLGDYSAYQLCVTVCFFMCAMSGVEVVTIIFVGGDMPHWCKVPELLEYSFDRQKDIAIPLEDSDAGTYSSCEMFNLNYSSFSDEEFRNWSRSDMVGNNTDLVYCEDWVYEQTTFVSTIVSRFDLVCSKNLWPEFITTIYFMGYLVGVLVSGAVSDRFGRWITMVIFVYLRIVTIFVSIFAVNYAMFAIGRFFQGIGSAATLLAQFVLMMEIFSPRFRVKASTFVAIGYSVGCIISPIVAYFVRDEVKYQLAILGPNAIFFSLILIIDESPRWLVVNKKFEKARKILEHICSVNGTKLPADFDVRNIELEDRSVHRKANCGDLIRTRNMRTKTLVMDFIWFTTSLVFLGLSLNTGSLPGNIYVNTVISSAIEIPGKVVCIFLLEWKVLGRRLTTFGCFLFVAAANLICIPLILYGYSTAVTGISMIGKMFSTMIFSAIYVYAAEIYPTEIRHIGVGTASMFARLGSMIAPFMGAPMISIWRPLPCVIFGSLALVAGLLCLLLPETLGKPMPDTINEANDVKGVTMKVEAVSQNITEETNSADDYSNEKAGNSDCNSAEIYSNGIAGNTNSAEVYSNGIAGKSDRTTQQNTDNYFCLSKNAKKKKVPTATLR